MEGGISSAVSALATGRGVFIWPVNRLDRIIRLRCILMEKRPFPARRTAPFWNGNWPNQHWTICWRGCFFIAEWNGLECTASTQPNCRLSQCLCYRSKPPTFDWQRRQVSLFPESIGWWVRRRWLLSNVDRPAVRAERTTALLLQYWVQRYGQRERWGLIRSTINT